MCRCVDLVNGREKKHVMAILAQEEKEKKKSAVLPPEPEGTDFMIFEDAGGAFSLHLESREKREAFSSLLYPAGDWKKKRAEGAHRRRERGSLFL